MKPLLIVGIDPGTTLGYALLDIKGNLLEIKSRRVHTLASITNEIIKHGQILIVASDKKKTPDFVETFAKKTGAKLFTPDHDLLQKEKKEFVKEHSGNSHELDALASALWAYNENRKILSKGIRFVERNEIDRPNEIISFVVKAGVNFREAAELYKNDKRIKPLQDLVIKNLKKSPEKKAQIMRFFEKINTLTKKNTYLQNNIVRLKEERQQLLKANNSMQKTIERIQKKEKKEKALRLKDKKIELLNIENIKLKKRITRISASTASLHKLISSLKDNYLAVKLNDLSTAEIMKAKEFTILIVENPAIYTEKSLDKLNKKYIISKNNIPTRIRKKTGVYWMNSEKVKIICQTNTYAVISKENIDTMKTDVVEKIITDYRKRRN